MLNIRVIPCLLLKGSGLVKTIKFKHPVYIGDPINAVRIFNDKEIDEIIFLDINATEESRGPNFNLISDIASEAFMPFAYGGGITTLREIETLIKIGVEKVVLNTSSYMNPQLVADAFRNFGSQSIVVSIDVKKNIFGKYEVWIKGGMFNTKKHPADYAMKMQDIGAGEIFLNSIDRDGTCKGYDIELIKSVTDVLDVPLIASGGAGSHFDLKEAVLKGNASAVAAGSLFVFYGPLKAVLITYPPYNLLENLFIEK